MRFLIVSFYFPPYNTVGAIRVGKFARYLTEMGHDVHVIAARSPAMEQRDASLPVEISPTRVAYTRWLDINNLPRAWVGGHRARQSTVNPTEESLPSLLRPVAKTYLSLTSVPDSFWGWRRYAQTAGKVIARQHPPDAILASGPPFTAFQVAKRLASELSVPWFADFRDLWADKEPYPFQSWRRTIDRWQQRRTLATATGVVTVSAPLAESLRLDGIDCPIEVVYNGFDPDDVPPRVSPSTHGPLRVLYAGSLYGDPAPLFAALALLPRAEADIRVEFLLRGDASTLMSRARSRGVLDAIDVLEPVSYQECLERQAAADALLLIQGEGPAWRGIVSGKIFEYLAAGRPILALAGASSVVQQILTDSGAGCASRDPTEIASWLRARLAEKRSGGVPHVNASNVGDYTRSAQTRRLEQFVRTRITRVP